MPVEAELPPADGGRAGFPRMGTAASLAVIASAFWLGVLRHVELPGLFMDAVNPDYLAARVLHPALKNPVWALPTAWFPILGNLYHGVQNFYVDVPVLWLLGTNVIAVRIAQALFGLAIVLLTYFVLLRATGNRIVAVAAAVALSTDVSFLASFRTQFYIVMGGEAWLLASLLLLLPGGAPGTTPRRRFASGLLFGLAVYGYFVYLFFLPAMLALSAGSSVGGRWRAVRAWLAGALAGSFPYLAGYASMAIALGGVRPELTWVSRAVAALAPTASAGGSMGGVLLSARDSILALDGAGNELMIFGVAQVPAIVHWRLMALVVLVLAAAVLGWWLRGGVKVAGWIQAWSICAPLSYVLLASLLGARLWVHHYSLLVPLVYIAAGIGAAAIWSAIRAGQDRAPRRWQWSAAVLGAAILLANISQQQVFFSRLEETGGVKRFSSALTRLSEDALDDPRGAVYVFPDWGFFMPFALLTGNRIPYEIGWDPATVRRLRSGGHEVRVVYWEPSDARLYAEAGADPAGATREPTTVYRQRDGAAAFFMTSLPAR